MTRILDDTLMKFFIKCYFGKLLKSKLQLNTKTEVFNYIESKYQLNREDKTDPPKYFLLIKAYYLEIAENNLLIELGKLLYKIFKGEYIAKKHKESDKAR